jgi:hypothetical protein
MKLYLASKFFHCCASDGDVARGLIVTIHMSYCYDPTIYFSKLAVLQIVTPCNNKQHYIPQFVIAKIDMA